nr:triose-phosphate isomerase [Pseudoduganella ginsengisoli]
MIAGNWKMNGSFESNGALLRALKEQWPTLPCDVLVCAPAVYLAQCRAELAGTGIGWGAQDVSAHTAGAYTGEVAAAMLADVGCSHVIVGHSEPRSYHGHSDALIAQKCLRALESSLAPILCVGETLAERDAGLTNAVVMRQLGAVLEMLTPRQAAQLVVAYEPVWAIGTGRTATPDMAQEVHATLRRQLHAFSPDAAATVRILYGGSMKPDNAPALMAMPDIDGGLIGGASLQADSFSAIIRAAA